MSAVILIVEDDEDSRELIRSTLEAEGMRALSAQSGDEALRLVADGLPDLALMDAMMPGLDGFATCRRIKALPGGEHLPVIFMTGLTETRDVLRGLQAGGVDYVTKPLVLDELLARIQVHLGNARVARRALVALDTTGGRVVAADAAGRVLWATGQALDLLAELGEAGRETVEMELAMLIARAAGRGTTASLDLGSAKLAITMLDPTSEAEHLFSLSRSVEGREAEIFQSAFGLTRREADVLLWVARGKSNKDASEILNISARTVNKHLEQIFIKMGVENRATAAALATRTLLER